MADNLAVQPTAHLPVDRARHNVQGLVDRRLYLAVKEQLQKNGHSVTQLVDWACREYLYRAAPQRAADLGIGEEGVPRQRVAENERLRQAVDRLLGPQMRAQNRAQILKALEDALLAR